MESRLFLWRTLMNMRMDVGDVVKRRKNRKNKKKILTNLDKRIKINNRRLKFK